VIVIGLPPHNAPLSPHESEDCPVLWSSVNGLECLPRPASRLSCRLCWLIADGAIGSQLHLPRPRVQDLRQRLAVHLFVAAQAPQGACKLGHLRVSERANDFGDFIEAVAGQRVRRWWNAKARDFVDFIEAVAAKSVRQRWIDAKAFAFALTKRFSIAATTPIAVEAVEFDGRWHRPNETAFLRRAQSVLPLSGPRPSGGMFARPDELEIRLQATDTLP